MRGSAHDACEVVLTVWEAHRQQNRYVWGETVGGWPGLRDTQRAGTTVFLGVSVRLFP